MTITRVGQTITFVSAAGGGVTSFKGNAGTARTVAIVILNGAGILITESPNGTYTIATTAFIGTPVTSFAVDAGGATTGALTLASGTNVTLAQVGNTVTINVTGVASQDFI